MPSDTASGAKMMWHLAAFNDILSRTMHSIPACAQPRDCAYIVAA